MHYLTITIYYCKIILRFGGKAMNKTCFVIMGFGIKNNINLDLTYNKIIKPCIMENDLVPFPLYEETKYNAYRCDEICGTTSIDYKFVTCLNGADIVIADISTMNANAIYELGARHALKPRSTILLCAKNKEKDFKFFDITYVPIVFYEHDGMKLSSKSIIGATQKLNAFLDFAINSSTTLPDNPIQRALIEKTAYPNVSYSQNSVYQLYLHGKDELDNNEFEKAEVTLRELFAEDPSEENLLLLVLAKYKKAEKEKSCKGLIDCINLVTDNIDINNSNSEYLFGRLAAISLRIYHLCGDSEYYYSALEYYRRGAIYCRDNLYCPRNYCAVLVKIYEITDDVNIIKEYYYTAKHYAKLYLTMNVSAKRSGNYDDRIYYHYNANDLRSIISGEYQDYDKVRLRLENDQDISKRQKSTILEGIRKLKNDLAAVDNLIKSFSN